MVYEDNSISHNITTNAGFRAWAQKIHDGLAAVGLAQTADTGQINLSTVNTPGSDFAFAGYEIWRFDDSDQAAEPVYLKLEYGRADSASRGTLKLTVGTGSDGSGSLTNGCLRLVQLSGGVNPSGNGLIYIAFGDGALVIFVIANKESTSFLAPQHFVVERIRDDEGLVSGGIGAFFWTWSAAETTMAVRVRIDGTWEGQGQSASGTWNLWGMDVPSRARGGKQVFGGLRYVKLPCEGTKVSRLALDDGTIARGETGEIDGVLYKRPDTAWTQTNEFWPFQHFLMPIFLAE